MDKIKLSDAVQTDFWRAVGAAEPWREIAVEMSYGDLMAICILIDRYREECEKEAQKEESE